MTDPRSSTSVCGTALPASTSDSIASFDARELPGTEGAFGPFLSPNGLWIAYFVGNQLRKIRVDGGAPITVAQAPNSNGGDWAEDGTIVFATNEGIRLERVSDQGGATERLGIPGAWDRYQWPQVVPGTSEVLLSGPRTMLWALDVETGAAYEIGEPVGEARYLPSGHMCSGPWLSDVRRPFRCGEQGVHEPDRAGPQRTSGRDLWAGPMGRHRGRHPRVCIRHRGRRKRTHLGVA